RARRARTRSLRGPDDAPGAPGAADRRADDHGPRAARARPGEGAPDDHELRGGFPARSPAVSRARLRGVPHAHAGPAEPDARAGRAAADRPGARHATAGPAL